MMVRLGDADALIGGLTTHYPDTIRPALQVIDVRPELRRVAGVYVLITPKGDIYFLADATVNIEPTAEDLAEIAIMAAEKARRFNQEPRVAMLSFSNFGSTRHPLADKVRRAVELVRQRAPGLMIDGEMQADTAVAPQIIDETYPVQHAEGRRQRADLPEPGIGQHRLQAAAAHRRRGADRAAADGACASRSTCCSAAPKSTTSCTWPRSRWWTRRKSASLTSR